MKNFYKIAVSWEEYGYLNIEAESLEEAMKIAEDDESIALPKGHYVDASWRVEDLEYQEALNA